MTIVLYHSTGVPMGTGLMIPLATSLSRLAFTLAFQLYSTGICTGVVDMDGKGVGLLMAVLAN